VPYFPANAAIVAVFRADSAICAVTFVADGTVFELF
jgi:hypothetical protein